MTRAAALATAKIGPGRLVLVVGPSGAGKDTLIKAAHAMGADDPRIVFLRRIVTRAASLAEDNIEISPEAFARDLADGQFALHWRAHDHDYALSQNLDDDIRAGSIVVANVSRSVIDAARLTYADVVVVLITAPAEVLAARLAARSRRSDGSIAERVGRSVAATAEVSITNVGPVDGHARELLEVIRHGRPHI